MLTIATNSFSLDIAGVLDLPLHVLCHEMLGNKPQLQTLHGAAPLTSGEDLTQNNQNFVMGSKSSNYVEA